VALNTITFDYYCILQLEKVTISFDGGLTTMNFAEAAMVIQGSVCVYSKKVKKLIF
jgi:condensin-2 complex subunit H2